MGDPVTFGIITTALVGGSTGYQIYNTEKGKKDAAKQRTKMGQEQMAQEYLLQQKQKEEVRKRNEAYTLAVNQSRMTGTSRPTILTSPMGLPKTLLGQ